MGRGRLAPRGSRIGPQPAPTGRWNAERIRRASGVRPEAPSKRKGTSGPVSPCFGDTHARLIEKRASTHSVPISLLPLWLSGTKDGSTAGKPFLVSAGFFFFRSREPIDSEEHGGVSTPPWNGLGTASLSPTIDSPLGTTGRFSPSPRRRSPRRVGAGCPENGATSARMAQQAKLSQPTANARHPRISDP